MDAHGVDLTGLTGTWSSEPGGPWLAARPSRPVPRWLRRTAAVVVVAGVVLGAWWVGSVVVATVTGGWDGFLQSFTHVPLFLLLVVGQLLLPRLRPAVTRVDADAVATRPTLGPWRTSRWEDVAAVQPGTRWDPTPVVVLTDGTRRPLPGLPREVGERLAQAVVRSRPDAAERPPGRDAPARRSEPPPGDEGMDGPFRRGPGGG